MSPLRFACARIALAKQSGVWSGSYALESKEENLVVVARAALKGNVNNGKDDAKTPNIELHCALLPMEC